MKMAVDLNLFQREKSVECILVTYRNPNVKSKTTATFLFALVLRFQDILTGIKKISMSVIVLNAPLAVRTSPRLRHVPGTLLSQILLLGVH